MVYPRPIEKLIELFTRFPGIGPKQAARFAFYLLKENSKTVEELSESIKELHKKVGFCQQCFKSIERDSNTRIHSNDSNILCEFCRNKNRDENIIMIVEKEQDLLNIERTKKFNGLYHVLGGIISPLDSSAPAKLHIKDLFERIKKLLILKKEAEVILATNPTREGEATAIYLSNLIKPLSLKVTRIAQGIPRGGEIEYLDESTLKSSLEGRREI